MRTFLVSVSALVIASSGVWAGDGVAYKEGDTPLEGYLAKPQDPGR